ncbi:MAG: GNAT family N-acetyltransferase [Anaerolineae bacterium]
MPEAPRILVRDGTEDDIAACLALDSRYETGHVLQVYLHGQESQGWNIGLQRERLPRPVELSLPVHRALIRRALEQEYCFLVAESREEEKPILGCLVLTPDHEHGFGLIQSLVVSGKVRRQQIGLRLLAASRTWAKEKSLNRLMAELQTKNAPAIAFLEAVGFTFCGFNDHYFSDESIALFFSLPLK